MGLDTPVVCFFLFLFCIFFAARTPNELVDAFGLMKTKFRKLRKNLYFATKATSERTSNEWLFLHGEREGQKHLIFRFFSLYLFERMQGGEKRIFRIRYYC